MAQESARDSKAVTGSPVITRAEELSYELKVSDVMVKDVVTMSPDTPMMHVLSTLYDNRITGMPVVKDGELLGVISLGDLVRAMRPPRLGAPVSDFMTRDVITIREEETLIEVLKLFAKEGFGRFPVVDAEGKMVGMVTKGDVTTGLLSALEKAYSHEEETHYYPTHLFEGIISDHTSLILRYQVMPRDITRGGQASSHIKKALLRLGLSPKVVRPISIAAYEAEINLMIHATNGGDLTVEVDAQTVRMVASDDGPGIEDTELAMQPGYSTADEEALAWGFGAGMGLPNIKRCVDEMRLESEPDEGTYLEMIVYLE